MQILNGIDFELKKGTLTVITGPNGGGKTTLANLIGRFYDATEGEVEVFGANVPVSSLKGHLGHTLGASGPLEMAAVFEMARHGVLIPTRNLVDVAPACAGIDHLTTPRENRIRIFFKNSFAFGGINASLICKLNV